MIDGLPIVDPTLFKHEGRYWLLFTLQDDGAWGNQKLYAYHAPALDAPWVPHALNPVKCDIGATRPAGNVLSAAGNARGATPVPSVARMFPCEGMSVGTKMHGMQMPK